MQRTCMTFLKEWLNSDDRRPLVIRGARQVGKTWVVRELAKSEGRKLVELNLERKPDYISLFSSNDPGQIMLNISSFAGDIDPQKTLLFLDEIQASPELLAKLRWFAEEMPELPVIAAGSLLEFVLAQHTFSMPVGRIQYIHLEPLSFEEFLQAQDKDNLVNYIKKYQLEREFPLVVHNELMVFFKEYILIGGMPQAVDNWVTKKSLAGVQRIHADLIATYRDDFNKYNGRLSIERLDEVIKAVPFSLGQKFMYSRVNPNAQASSIKQALDLLCKAKVCHKVFGSAANGIPLGAELQDKYLKVLFLDVGLCSSLLGLVLDQLNAIKDITLINSGGISEQVVGQLLRTIAPFYLEPELYYWHRSEKSSNAEVDYVIQFRNKVIPLEVKSGSTGSLKSLHLFMGLKKYAYAVRVNADIPSKTQVSVKDHTGSMVEYTLISIPYYLLSELPRMLATVVEV